MMKEYIDVTPTWEALVPLFVEIIRNGEFQARMNAEEELYRMARAADVAVRMQKEAGQ
jgi:hypothetical protein